MSQQPSPARPKVKKETTVRVPEFRAKKQRGEKIVVLTAYDATMARLIDQAGVDAVLVGDSLGNVIMGAENTLGVTMDVMVHHTRAVVNGTRHALVIADMPFLSYQTSIADAVRNGGRLLAEGGAAAVKLEGGRPMAETVSRLTEVGIPVMGHVGLTPQSIHQMGGYKRVAAREVDRLVEDAKLLEQAGAFSIVLELMDPEAARAVTAAIKIPTIGIGAGVDCDGQVLVSYDMLGLYGDTSPSFVKRYVELGEQVRQATQQYATEVREGKFPK